MWERKKRSFVDIYTPEKNGLDDVVLDELVKTGKLPRDILFQLQTVDEDDREAALEQAVLCAMRSEALPLFATGRYPDAAWIPNRPASYLPDIDEDYHALVDYREVARGVDLQDWRAEQAWHRFICEIRPELAEQMTAFAEDRRKGSGARALYISSLYRTVIKDEALLGVHESLEEKEGLRKALGHKAVSALGYLLADNHPDLFQQVDKA